MTKKNEYGSFFFEERGGVQSSLAVMGGHRWSYSIDIRRKKTKETKYICTADAKNDDNDY
jgi:hypothetical protein